MFTRNTLFAALLVLAVSSAPAQNYLSGTRLRLVEPLPTQVFGGILIPPTPTLADVIFNLPSTGGYLLVDDGTGKVAWLVGGNPLTSTGLLGSTTAQDVSFIAGGTGNVRMRLEDDVKAVSLPDSTELRFVEQSASGTNYTGFAAQTQVGNITYTLPSTVGIAGNTLAIAATPPPTPTSATLEWKAISDPDAIVFGFLATGQQLASSCTEVFKYHITTPGTYAIKGHIRFLNDNSTAGKVPKIAWILPGIGSSITYNYYSLSPAGAEGDDIGTINTPDCTDIEATDAFTFPDGEEYSILGFITATADGDITLQLGKSGGSWHVMAGSYMVIYKQ